MGLGGEAEEVGGHVLDLGLPPGPSYGDMVPSTIAVRFLDPSAHSVASWSLPCLCQSLCPTLAASTTRTSVLTSAEHSR